MKTAISLPDETFERATHRAKQLGMSRSEFFTRAAQCYLKQLDEEKLTEEINTALSSAGDDDSWQDAAESGRALLSGSPDW